MDVSGRVGEYELGERLGKGSMGSVYEARAPGGSRVALKLLERQDERSLARFRRETRIGCALEHPNVVRVLDAGEEARRPYLVMEFVEGRTVGAILRERGRLPGKLVLQFAEQVAEGLGALHALELVHRDLKPENLMVDRGGVVKITDLGLARTPALEEITRAGTMVGTPAFMSPEQVRGEAAAPSMDLFALALLLFRCLTGRHAFRREEFTDVLPYLQNLLDGDPERWHEGSPGGPLDRFFRRALAKEVPDRYPDARALVAAFREAFDAERERHGF